MDSSSVSTTDRRRLRHRHRGNSPDRRVPLSGYTRWDVLQTATNPDDDETPQMASGQGFVEPLTGFEPATIALQERRSTN
jgi:hypothetical protein